MDHEIIGTLRTLLVSDLFVEVPEQDIDPDAGLQSTYGLDSVAFLELRVLSERRFGVTISDTDFVPEHFRTLNRLARLITSLQADQAGAAS
jgi:acyl carrier protein